ncbi:DNA invertase [Undibacterium sp. KW1]|nr:DNA invertase [Undibacterium sp. KW1]BBB62296.1 DNA invertase [Undibacterium sp. KW1]
MVKLAEDLRQRGIHLHSITDGIDTGTPAGRFFFNVMASLAEMERDLLRERTRAGLAAARNRGHLGGRRMTITPGQLEAARSLIAAGNSIRQTAIKLDIPRATLHRNLQSPIIV